MPADPANWERFRGNNHENMAPPTLYRGGSVSFKRHLGRPLSDALWEDLRHRFGMTGLCIYGLNDSQWTMGWGSGHVIITLEENGDVDDIRVNPYMHKTITGPVIMQEEIGPCFGNAAGIARVEF